MTKPNIKIHLQEELLKRKTFSIPSVQRELRIKYGDLRECVSEMEKIGQVTLADDGLNYIVADNPENLGDEFVTYLGEELCQLRGQLKTRLAMLNNGETYDNDEDFGELTFEEKIERKQELLDRLSKLDDDEEILDEIVSDECDEIEVHNNAETPSDETIAQRRQELLERIARLCEEGEGEAEDDDADENDYRAAFEKLDVRHHIILDSPPRKVVVGKNFDDLNGEEEASILGLLEDAAEHAKKYVAKASECKMIDGVEYDFDHSKAALITKKLQKRGYKLTFKSIQYGPYVTGFVFDYPPQKKDICGLNRLANLIEEEIEDCRVRIIAPWGDNRVCILMYRDLLFDHLCKKVLQYWVRHNDGFASIASAQRGLGIGFYRAGKILSTLQKMGCVEQSSLLDEDFAPARVQIDLQDIDTLFPKWLGWD